jgi:hypothetical protein
MRPESLNDEVQRPMHLPTMRRAALQDIIRESKGQSFELLSNKIKAYSLDKGLGILGVKDDGDFVSIFLTGTQYQFKKPS